MNQTPTKTKNVILLFFFYQYLLDIKQPQWQVGSYINAGSFVMKASVIFLFKIYTLLLYTIGVIFEHSLRIAWALIGECNLK